MDNLGVPCFRFTFVIKAALNALATSETLGATGYAVNAPRQSFVIVARTEADTGFSDDAHLGQAFWEV
jgi:hypothetical protein